MKIEAIIPKFQVRSIDNSIVTTMERGDLNPECPH